ncbi:hypothetical protein O1611_g4264 [Lasiodiplodia mahajangana]|uniref:Uncharacterized protein n=1 Tax=Lasiodiplodia mahajangana TaxID=1108764 RepID=A0ACC2JPU7_9PEZI|nr:hypothetical protein O1611_g4264 [Lasiodiplodia mahajangana]
MTELCNAIDEAGLGLLRLMLCAIFKATVTAAMGSGPADKASSWACGRWRRDEAPVGFASLILLVWLRHARPKACRRLLLGVAILYHVPAVSSMPVPSNDSATDIAMRSYELTRISFIVMATMGAVMTTLALIKATADVVRYCLKRRTCESKPTELPRNPINCHGGAVAHAALGQRVSDGTPDPDFGQELSSISETAAAIDIDHQRQPMAMPAKGLPLGQV